MMIMMMMMLINSEIASITGVVLRPFDLDFFLFVNAFQPKQYRHRCFSPSYKYPTRCTKYTISRSSVSHAYQKNK
jgi:hypothetical protein